MKNNMMLRFLFVFLFLNSCMSMCTNIKPPNDAKYNIVNSNLPKCIDCVHYIPPDYTFISDYGNCKKYGKMNIVTGVITNDFTKSCREDENKCGLEAKNFVKEENLQLKKLKHNYDKVKFPLLIGILFGLEASLIIYKYNL